MVEKGECILTHGLHCTHIYTITYNPQLNVTHKSIINRFLIISLASRVYVCLYACKKCLTEKETIISRVFHCSSVCIESLSKLVRVLHTRFRGGEKIALSANFLFFPFYLSFF